MERSMMERSKREITLVAGVCLLLLVAGYRFWGMLEGARDRTALSTHSTLIGQKIVSNIGPPRPDPFAGLNLTDEQRHRIDDILNASLPPLSPSDKTGASGPHLIKIRFPAAKIRAVLTPEQQRKFDLQGHRVMHIAGPADPLSSPPPMRMMLHGPDEGPH